MKKRRKPKSFEIDSLIRDEAAKPSTYKAALARPIRLATRVIRVRNEEDSVHLAVPDHDKLETAFLRASTEIQEPWELAD